MFGLGSLNPKKMQAVMKQLGMKQEEIEASEVIIKKRNGNEIRIENPSVTKMNIQGSEIFQISGESKEKTQEIGISQEDIKTIIEKTGVSEEKAKETLEKTKDLAEAIIELNK
ncbi:nascent polypeptide-associated complex protein [Candidatus Pacearchaeota archaeon]|nr:MAG: nascent polypeptide-associated complex protein [Candidatus Pacearchaeota archaeon]